MPSAQETPATSPLHPQESLPGTATGARWQLSSSNGQLSSSLAGALNTPEWLAAVLCARGFRDLAQASAFLHPTAAHLHDPFLMHGMATAVERILDAIARREPMLIYGDYDVDGTLATVLLKTAIDRLTPKDTPSLVRYHIPHRIHEGYGVQHAVLGDVAEAGVRLVISVDTGMRAFAAAEEAQRLGLDLIVTDHHLPDGLRVPAALAVINPNQRGCGYPFQDLCGAAVAFKLAQALLQSAHAHANAAALQPVDAAALHAHLLPSLLKLVAIATVADAVPLRDENRAIVSLGLRALQQVRQPGLRSLLDLAAVGTGNEPPTATEIAFRVAPRINAAGRMDIAADVVRMLLTRDAEVGRALAEKLHRLNDERRAVESSVLDEIEAMLAALAAHPSMLEAAGCLVLDGHGWHRGVVGILASRVVERTRRPALVITHEDGLAHGSGRSIAGFHLLDALTDAHEAHGLTHGTALFERFGGHAHAVGFSLASEHVGPLRAHLAAYSQTRLTPEVLEQTLGIDAELPFAAITHDILRHLRRLEPFGHGNPEPVFLARTVTVRGLQVLKERHLKLRLEQDGSSLLTCLCWSRTVPWPERLAAQGISLGSRVDIAFHLRENAHPDFGGPELQLCDLRPAQERSHGLPPLHAEGTLNNILQRKPEPRVSYTDLTRPE